MQLNNVFVVKDVIALGVLTLIKAVDIRFGQIPKQKVINKKGREFNPHGPYLSNRV
jgi:hypothetical protein